MDAAVVGEEDDEGVLLQPQCLQFVEHAADAGVHVFERGEVGGVMDAFFVVAQGAVFLAQGVGGEDGAVDGGGIGWDWTSVRSQGSFIDGHKNAAGGIVPFLKMTNDLAVAVDQLGTRKGAIAIYIEP